MLTLWTHVHWRPTRRGLRIKVAFTMGSGRHLHTRSSQENVRCVQGVRMPRTELCRRFRRIFPVWANRKRTRVERTPVHTLWWHVGPIPCRTRLRETEACLYNCSGKHSQSPHLFTAFFFFFREVAARNSKGNAQGCCCFKPKQLAVENIVFIFFFLYSYLLVIAFVVSL